MRFDACLLSCVSAAQQQAFPEGGRPETISGVDKETPGSVTSRCGVPDRQVPDAPRKTLLALIGRACARFPLFHFFSQYNFVEHLFSGVSFSSSPSPLPPPLLCIPRPVACCSSLLARVLLHGLVNTGCYYSVGFGCFGGPKMREQAGNSGPKIPTLTPSVHLVRFGQMTKCKWHESNTASTRRAPSCWWCPTVKLSME